ncbi:MAG: hypothetical protein NTX25_18550, partial [Proteobacteria bacterium]|nr:hypothetical protein [Pseudomonadota bacterium]
MLLRVSLGILLLFCKSVPGFAQLETAGPNPEPTPAKKLSENENSGYRSHPVWSDMLRLWSQDYLAFSKNLMGYSWQSYAGVGAATLSLLPFDQKIRDEAKDLGRRNNLLREDTQERRAFKFKLLGTPQGVFVPRGVMGYIW